MARASAIELARAAKWCSLKRITVLLCCLNLIVALVVVRLFYVSYLDRVRISRISEAQGKRVLESIRLRKELEPADLVEIVGKLKRGIYKEEEMVVELPESVKEKLAIEILGTLKNVSDVKNVTEQQVAVEFWRVHKLEELEKLTNSKSSSNSSISYQEAEMLKLALDFNWQKVMEDIGLWMPANVINTEQNRPENEKEIEEEIIPGRPMPPECHAEPHTDYDGAAVRWGLTHHTESAADCCLACLDQAKRAKAGQMKCNIWVYCPSEFGCFSPDIYEHKHQECWLKQAEKPRLNFKDKYSESYRNVHPTAPVIVPWMSGVVAT